MIGERRETIDDRQIVPQSEIASQLIGFFRARLDDNELSSDRGDQHAAKASRPDRRIRQRSHPAVLSVRIGLQSMPQWPHE